MSLRPPRYHATPLTQAVLVFPLFAIYQLGVAAGAARNGVDWITTFLVALSNRSQGRYALLLASSFVAYALLLAALRRRGRFAAADFARVLLESAVYAAFLGSAILLVIRFALPLLPHLAVGGAGALDVVVLSAGAGLHEELVFRLCLMGGLTRVLAPTLGARSAWVGALVLSSLAFAAVHHLGPAGDPFTTAAFAYRALAGAAFALLFRFRGFAVAAWTHALYDLYVLSIR